MTALLTIFVAVSGGLSAIFVARILFLGPKMAYIAGAIGTGALMYWSILIVVNGMGASQAEGVALARQYWLWSCIAWIPAYYATLWLLMRNGRK